MIPVSYWKIAEQNYCSINDKATYPFFISNKFTDFLDSIWFFLIAIYVFEKKKMWKFYKIRVTSRISDMFL